jgi:hypothetical protein
MNTMVKPTKLYFGVRYVVSVVVIQPRRAPSLRHVRARLSPKPDPVLTGCMFQTFFYETAAPSGRLSPIGNLDLFVSYHLHYAAAFTDTMVAAVHQ